MHRKKFLHPALPRITLQDVSGKPKPPKSQTWRPRVEDRRLMQELKHKLGVMADSEILRMGLRKLAEAQGIESK